MFCTKIWLFLGFLTICAAVAENDGIQDVVGVSTTSLPVALQFSEHKQSNENEVLQFESEKNTKDVDGQVDEINISSDIEVFAEKNGPDKGKQEEEPVVTDESPSDAEEPTNEETETTNETDAVGEEGGDAAPTAEVETATESKSNEETAAGVENGQEAGIEDEKATTQPNDVTDAPGVTTGNDAAAMPNDEPAKGDDSDNPDSTKALDTTDMEKNKAFCFACASNEEVKCAIEATKEIKCPKANEGDAGKHNGCYTLYQADTNITMRGCVDDLAEGGLKYCLTNDRLCNLCYSNGCNDKLAPSTAAKLQLNIYTQMILNVSSFVLIKCAVLKFY